MRKIALLLAILLALSCVVMVPVAAEEAVTADYTAKYTTTTPTWGEGTVWQTFADGKAKFAVEQDAGSIYVRLVYTDGARSGSEQFAVGLRSYNAAGEPIIRAALLNTVEGSEGCWINQYPKLEGRNDNWVGNWGQANCPAYFKGFERTQTPVLGGSGEFILDFVFTKSVLETLSDVIGMEFAVYESDAESYKWSNVDAGYNGAISNAATYGTVALERDTANYAKKAPTVDGTIDPAWDAAEWRCLTKSASSTDCATPMFKIMHDASNIYFLGVAAADGYDTGANCGFIIGFTGADGCPEAGCDGVAGNSGKACSTHKVVRLFTAGSKWEAYPNATWVKQNLNYFNDYQVNNTGISISGFDGTYYVYEASIKKSAVPNMTDEIGLEVCYNNMLNGWGTKDIFYWSQVGTANLNSGNGDFGRFDNITRYSHIDLLPAEPEVAKYVANVAVDGTIDPAWDAATWYNLTKVAGADTNAAPMFKVMQDASAIYFLGLAAADGFDSGNNDGFIVAFAGPDGCANGHDGVKGTSACSTHKELRLFTAGSSWNGFDGASWTSNDDSGSYRSAYSVNTASPVTVNGEQYYVYEVAISKAAVPGLTEGMLLEVAYNDMDSDTTTWANEELYYWNQTVATGVGDLSRVTNVEGFAPFTFEPVPAFATIATATSAPTIDGTVDGAWAGATALTMGHEKEGTAGVAETSNAPTLKLMTYCGKLYVLAQFVAPEGAEYRTGDTQLAIGLHGACEDCVGGECANHKEMHYPLAGGAQVYVNGTWQSSGKYPYSENIVAYDEATRTYTYEIALNLDGENSAVTGVTDEIGLEFAFIEIRSNLEKVNWTGDMNYTLCNGNTVSMAALKAPATYGKFGITVDSHTREVLTAVNATCTKTGLTEGAYCSTCDFVLVKQEVIAALGHSGAVDAPDADGKVACEVCGERYHQATLGGSNITLGGALGVNFYYLLEEGLAADAGAYVEFTIADAYPNPAIKQTVYLANAGTDTQNGLTYRVFTANVYGTQMTAEIQAQMFNGAGYAVSAIETFTVKDNAMAIVNGDAYSAEAKALAKALLNYGATVQIASYAGYDEFAPANEGLEADDQIPTPFSDDEKTALANYAYEISEAIDGVNYYGSTVGLDSEMSIRHYFQDVTNLVFTVGETAITPVMDDNASGLWLVEIPDISADKLATEYVLTVTNTETNRTQTYTSSVYSYINDVCVYWAEWYDEATLSAVTAIYRYSQAVINYMES